jgi:hypothetical protein
MTTLTIEGSDKSAEEILQIVKNEGGYVLAQSNEGITKEEQLSLYQGLKEAKMIQSGELKPLSFDDLWDE